MNFHNTQMGHNFYLKDVPELIKQLKRIAVALEKNNIKNNKEFDLNFNDTSTGK